MPSLIATLGANIAPFARGLDEAKGQAQTKGSGIASAFSNQIMGQLAGIASVAGITAIAKQTIAWGSQVSDLADRLGISTTAVQQWDFALKQNGSSVESVAPFFDRLAKARQDAFKGNDEAIASFRTFGITLEQLRTMRLEDIGAKIAQTFQQAPDPQPLMADLRNIGGRSAGELVTAFRAGLTDLFAVAPTATPEVIAQLDEVDDAFARVKAEFTAAIAPALVTVLNTIMEMINVARVVLAVPIGALMGLIDAAKSLTLSDVLTGKGVVKLGKAAFEGAGEAALAVVQQQQADKKAADDAAAARRTFRAGAGAIMPEEESRKVQAAREKQEAEARSNHMRHMDRIVKLEDDLRKKKQANALSEMDHAERIMELERRRAELAAKPFVPGLEADLERQIEMEDLSGKITEEERKQKGEAAKRLRPEANPLQQIGGFLGALQTAPELAMLDLNRKQEQHLAAIRKAVERKAPAPITNGGVGY